MPWKIRVVVSDLLVDSFISYAYFVKWLHVLSLINCINTIFLNKIYCKVDPLNKPWVTTVNHMNIFIHECFYRVADYEIIYFIVLVVKVKLSIDFRDVVLKQ